MINTDFHENDFISLYLSELMKIEDFYSAKQKFDFIPIHS